MPYIPNHQAGDIPLQIKAIKLLVVLAGDEIGNNLKGQNSPGICLPYIGRVLRLVVIFYCLLIAVFKINRDSERFNIDRYFTGVPERGLL